MLRLTSRASELFLQQPAAEQRRLLQTVLEKAAWKDGELQTALFEPFKILRHSNQERYRKEMEKTGSGSFLTVVGQTDRPLSAESQGSCTRRGENKAPSADARTQ